MSQQALGPAGRAGPSKARETKISAPKTTQTAYAAGAKPAKTAPAASTLAQTKTPAAPSVPRQYTNNTVLNPPAAQSPAQAGKQADDSRSAVCVG